MTQEKSQYRIYIDTTDRYLKKAALVELQPNNKEKELEALVGDFDTVEEIQLMLKSHNVDPKDCEILANPGPGSFTGVKIGVTIANIFNWATGKKHSPQEPDYGREPNITLKKDL